MEAGRSFKLGVIRLTERFIKSDPLAPRDERKLRRYIDAETGKYVSQLARQGFDRVIGTSGTIQSLGAVALAERGSSSTTLRNRRISAKQLRRSQKLIVARDIQERLRVPGLEPRRADLVAGSVLLDAILRRLGATDITLCDLSLRGASSSTTSDATGSEIAQANRYPDVRRRSVFELAERCNTGRSTRSEGSACRRPVRPDAHRPRPHRPRA
jgi:exopolyphosphatase/guanosine-5'-triphosphate,3'-diphosphate pyrophosphatase